eukprot:824442-Lingulodinium_polyedra.AAC.1
MCCESIGRGCAREEFGKRASRKADGWGTCARGVRRWDNLAQWIRGRRGHVGCPGSAGVSREDAA